MTNAALGIRGRLEVGETLTAWAVTSETSYSWQWQAWNGTAWVNVGPANSATYTIQASQVGYEFRIVATAGTQTYTSLETAAVTLDTKKDTAPTLAPDNSALLFGDAENVVYTNLFSRAVFGDADKGNYAGGSLLVQDTNSLSHGGDGHDVLSFQYGLGAGQFSYNAATRDVLYSFTGSAPVAIGRIDAALNGNGNDLKVVFNSNATAAVMGALVNKIQMSNNDDSPEHYRMLTAVVTDPTGRAAQYAIGAVITGLPDAPVFTSAASFSAAENQVAVGTVAAFDPDREVGTPQGISYSLVAGTGSADNPYFQVDAATGALSFKTAPDYESWNHSTQYAVRVRATDSEGSITEQAVTINVTNVNEAPFSLTGHATAFEDGGPVTFSPMAWDPDAGDRLTITYDASSLVGNLTFDGSVFRYDPAGRFNSLSAYSIYAEHLTYTATDAAGLSTTGTVNIDVFGANDPASITGTLAATIQEDSVAPWNFINVSGQVTVTDPDQMENRLYPDSGSSGTLGYFLTDNQGWSYTVSNGSIQYLGAGQSLENVYTIRSWDGTATQQVRITILGVNDAPAITGSAYTGTILEAGNLDNGAVAPGTPVVTGVSLASDVDSGDSFTWSGSANGTYGQFAIDSTTGQWTYTLDNARAATNALRENQTALDSFTIRVTDSHGAFTQSSINLPVHGANDAPVIAAGSQVTGTVTEPARTGSATFNLGGDLESEHFVALQPGGGIVLLGKVEDPFHGWHTALTHYGADGSRDMSYGANGVAALDGIVSPSGMALDAQGRTLVAGYTADNYAQTQVDWAIERRNADGSADLSFGTGGRVVIDFGGYDYSDNIFVDPAGHIVVSGVGRIVRLDADGSMDGTFGNGGVWDLAADPLVQGNYGLGTVDAQGRMLLTGSTYDDAGNTTIHLVRYLADGALDAGFGDAGHSSIAIGAGGIRAMELKTDAEGSITLAWSQYTDVLYYDPISVGRITSDGAIDTGFGAGGIARTTLSAGDLSLAIDAQGGALVGYTPAGWDDGDLSVVRFNAEGSRDASFGNGGAATVDLGDRDEIGTLNVSATGDIVVTGNAEWGNTEDIEFAGFHSDGTVDNTFGAVASATIVASGTLFATDVDSTGSGSSGSSLSYPSPPESLSWSGSAAGTYGTFTITAQGAWSYALDVNAAALQDLDEGETATETFTATVHDAYGATAAQPVVITIVGSEGGH